MKRVMAAVRIIILHSLPLAAQAQASTEALQDIDFSDLISYCIGGFLFLLGMIFAVAYKNSRK